MGDVRNVEDVPKFAAQPDNKKNSNRKNTVTTAFLRFEFWCIIYSKIAAVLDRLEEPACILGSSVLITARTEHSPFNYFTQLMQLDWLHEAVRDEIRQRLLKLLLIRNLHN